jgi:hypothetical protein
MQKKNRKEERKKLWCSHCQKGTHSFEKCWFKDKDKSKNNKGTKKDENYIIKEERETNLTLQLPGKIGNVKVNMVLDTGSTRKYISQELVNVCKLLTSEDKPIKVG